MRCVGLLQSRKFCLGTLISDDLGMNGLEKIEAKFLFLKVIDIPGNNIKNDCIVNPYLFVRQAV